MPLILHSVVRKLPWQRDKQRKNEDFYIDQVSERDWNEIKRLIRKRASVYCTTITQEERQNRKKYARRIIRKISLVRKKKSFLPLGKNLLAIRKKHSVLLRAFNPVRDETWKSVTRRDRTQQIIDLKDFSFIDSPQSAISSLQEIARAEAGYLDVHLNFRDQVCADIAPYLVLGLMNQHIPSIMTGGKITPAVTGMIEAVGLRGLLGITGFNRIQRDPTFHAFQIRSKSSPGGPDSKDLPTSISRAQKVSDALIETIDGWLLGMVRQRLNKEGKGNIAAIIGEVLSNAERHSDLGRNSMGDWAKDGDWAVAGFLTAIQDKEGRKTRYVCSLSIVSLGATICESICRCEDEKTRIGLLSYIRDHTKPGLFSEDSLATIYAMQDGISRLQQDETGDVSRGGVGMMDMVEFVGAMGALGAADAPPAITLISGRACIHIRAEHFLRLFEDKGAASETAAAGVHVPRRIWFNDSNDIAEPPSADYVEELPMSFPGTSVAIRFYISPTTVGDELRSGEHVSDRLA